MSRAIDARSSSPRAETLTETEKHLCWSSCGDDRGHRGGDRIVSYLVIFIIMAVMANTMAMTARERTAEYATPVKCWGSRRASRWRRDDLRREPDAGGAGVGRSGSG